MNYPIFTRKPLRRANGKIEPMTELKLRPPEDLDWAYSLASQMTAAEAVAEIKSRLGIDLRWAQTYSRFLQWHARRQQMEDFGDALSDYEQFKKAADPAAARQAVRATGSALLLDKAVREMDGKAFIGVARYTLAEDRVALVAKRLELTQRRVELSEKKLDLKREKYNDHKPPPPPTGLSYLEQEDEVRAFHGLPPLDPNRPMPEETPPPETAAPSAIPSPVPSVPSVPSSDVPAKPAPAENNTFKQLSTTLSASSLLDK